MSECSIQFINVTKEYDSPGVPRHCALAGVTLTIPAGEFVGVLGLNGSGKSTLARLANGLIRPTSGRVLVDGMDTANGIKDIRRKVGMVFQNPDNQIVSSVVDEDIAFGPENLGFSTSEVKERVDWALRVVGMEELRYHAPQMLSGGQKQRVAIAAALAMKPDYLILDEPTSMLDPEGRSQLLETLRWLNENLGIAVVLISHKIEDMVHARRLVVLDRGSVYFDGPSTEILASPAKLAAAGLKPPDVVQLVAGLNKCGHAIKDDILSVQQFVDYICKHLSDAP